MNKKILFSILILSFFFVGCGVAEKQQPQSFSNPSLTTSNMQLISPDFQNEGNIPADFTCDGSDKNPNLQISEVPENAKSLVLLMDDPDAVKPSGKVWDHWVVWNIPASTIEIPAGQEPTGIAGKGTGGNTGYHGPCPPDAEHRYYFKLYALDTELDLPEGLSKAEVENAMQGHVLEETSLMGRYNRK